MPFRMRLIFARCLMITVAPIRCRHKCCHYNVKQPGSPPTQQSTKYVMQNVTTDRSPPP